MGRSVENLRIAGGHDSGPRAKGTNTAWLYERLRRAILSLEIPPGENLEERDMVERFGMSRTPVRETLIRLAADGLVVLLPNRGARVAAVDLADFPGYVEALDLVQRAATRLAAMRRDDADLKRIKSAQLKFEKSVKRHDPLLMTECNRDYHAAIADAAHSRYLSSQYKHLLDQGMRILRIPFAYDPAHDDGLTRHIRKIISEHRAITQSIQSGDGAVAERRAHAHTRLFQTRCLQYLREIGTEAIQVDAD